MSQAPFLVADMKQAARQQNRETKPGQRIDEVIIRKIGHRQSADGSPPRTGEASASMKYGATGDRSRAAAIAATSREYQRSAAASLARRNAPRGSLRRNRPADDGAIADQARGPGSGIARSGGTNPRLTST
jgi:hypothetical protein